MEFKHEFPDFERRKGESSRLLARYPGKIPVIVEPVKNDPVLELGHNKFLVPTHYSFHELLFQVRKRFNVPAMTAVYVLVGNQQMPTMARILKDIYSEYADPDGFLYIQCSTEQVWG